MFEIYFSFLSIMFIKNIKEYEYFSLIHDETSMTRREIMRIIHKINLNKTFKINEVINKALQQFIHVIIK